MVLTAHPTQIVRRSLQYKLAKIAALLEENDRWDVTCPVNAERFSTSDRI